MPKDLEQLTARQQTTEKEISKNVLENFPKFSDDKVHQLLTNNYSDKELGGQIRKDIWSWTHLLEYDDTRIKDITKGEDLNLIESENGNVKFSKRSFLKKGLESNMFSCANTNPININSTQMLDTALNMKSLNGTGLMYVLDNYVLGSDTLEGQVASFNTLEYRDKVFSSSKLDWRTLEFLNHEQYNEKEVYDASERNPITSIGEEDFISKDVAKMAFETLLSNKDKKTLSYNIIHLGKTRQIICHLDNKDIKKLLDVAEVNEVVQSLKDREDLCDIIKDKISQRVTKKRPSTAATFAEKEQMRKESGRGTQNL